MEQQLIDALKRLPISVRIVTQSDLEGATWYCWQAADSSGKSLNFAEAVEQALCSVFAFIATDAGYTPDDFRHISHPTMY